MIDSLPSNGHDEKLPINLNIITSTSSSTLMMPRPFHKLSSSQSSNTMDRTCGSNNIITGPIISGRSPPIMSSYKAYKDFINNYTNNTNNLINNH